MSKKSKKRKYEDCQDYNLDNFKFLGQGHSGKVFLMPNGQIIKIFKNADNCKKEYDIYKAVEGSSYFPKAYKCSGKYLIREYVGGTNIKEYINKYGLNKVLAINLINLIDAQKKLGFTKCDVRFPHIFVQKNGSLIVIDPRNSFTEKIPKPTHLLKSLKRFGLFSNFINLLKEERPDLYKLWIN